MYFIYLSYNNGYNKSSEKKSWEKKRDNQNNETDFFFNIKLKWHWALINNFQKVASPFEIYFFINSETWAE